MLLRCQSVVVFGGVGWGGVVWGMDVGWVMMVGNAYCVLMAMCVDTMYNMC